MTRTRTAQPPPLEPQRSDWDCGVACALMAARGCDYVVTWDDIVSRLATQRVWSIDLFFALVRGGIACEYHTIALQAAQEHASIGFYQDTFEEDEQRVNALFAAAQRESLAVIEADINETGLANLLAGGHLLIVLVNAHALNTARAHLIDEYLLAAARAGGDTGKLDAFMGHFILLFDYNPRTDLFFFRNPYIHDNLVFSLTRAALARAREHSGTDKDVIIVKRKP